MGVSAFYVPGALEDREVHLFSNDDRGNIKVEIKSAKSPRDDADTVYNASKNSQKGFIVPTSHLDSTVVDSMRVVFAITYPPASDDCPCHDDMHEYDLSIVSPFYQQVSTVEKTINSVAAASDGTTAWVFSLICNDGMHRLQTTPLDSLVPFTIQNNAPVADRNTFLSAFYNPVKESAFAFYQTVGPKNFFVQYHVDKDSATEIKASDLPEDRTVFTVAWAKETNTVYLYYVDKYQALQRMTLLVDSKDDDHSWSSPTQIGNFQIPHDSQLSVVPSAENKVNNIFFKNAKGTFTHALDKWHH